MIFHVGKPLAEATPKAPTSLSGWLHTHRLQCDKKPYIRMQRWHLLCSKVERQQICSNSSFSILVTPSSSHHHLYNMKLIEDTLDSGACYWLQRLKCFSLKRATAYFPSFCTHCRVLHVLLPFYASIRQHTAVQARPNLKRSKTDG